MSRAHQRSPDMILGTIRDQARTLTLSRSKFLRLAICLFVLGLLRRMHFSRTPRALVKDLSKVGRRVGEEKAHDELAEYDVIIVGGGSYVPRVLYDNGSTTRQELPDALSHHGCQRIPISKSFYLSQGRGGL